jgi:hypothetical protein
MDKIALLIMILTSTAAYAQTDVFPLSEITSEDLTAIQRGWSPDIGQCAVDTVREIKIDYDAGQYWIVIADDQVQSITFEKLDGTNKMICEDGGRRDIGTGKNNSQVYDNLIPY